MIVILNWIFFDDSTLKIHHLQFIYDSLFLLEKPLFFYFHQGAYHLSTCSLSKVQYGIDRKSCNLNMFYNDS